jgi:hypothetical protein
MTSPFFPIQPIDTAVPGAERAMEKYFPEGLSSLLQLAGFMQQTVAGKIVVCGCRSFIHGTGYSRAFLESFWLKKTNELVPLIFTAGLTKHTSVS